MREVSLAEEGGRPDLAHQLIQAADCDLPELPADSYRRQRWSSEVHVLRANRLRCPAESIELRPTLAQIRGQMDREGWPPEERAASLIHLAAHALGTGATRWFRNWCSMTIEETP